MLLELPPNTGQRFRHINTNTLTHTHTHTDLSNGAKYNPYIHEFTFKLRIHVWKPNAWLCLYVVALQHKQDLRSLFRHSMFQIIWQRCNSPVSLSNYIPSLKPSFHCRSFLCKSFTFPTNSNSFTFTAAFQRRLKRDCTKAGFFRLYCCTCIFCSGSFLL